MTTIDTKQAFTWVPLYTELANRVCECESKQSELIQLLEDIRQSGHVVTPLMDRDDKGDHFLIKEIDPFTLFGTFNRGVKDEQRIAILRELKKHFDAESPLPTDFSGIPILNNKKSWFIAYHYKRKADDVSRLWTVFRLALDDDPLNNPEFLEAFDRALDVWGTNFNLTMGLFWIRPDTFLNLDQVNRSYLKIKPPSAGLNSEFYRKTVQAIVQQGKPLVEVSYEAWKTSVQPPPPTNNYWMAGASWDGSDPPDQTDRFLSESIWEHGEDGLDLVRSIAVGDRIAIKSTFTRKHDLPFDARGRTVSCMRIKAVGTVVANRGDNRTVEVEWDTSFKPKDWFLTAKWDTIQKLDPDGEEDRRLIDFVFHDARQDYDWFSQRLWKVVPKKPPYSLDDIIASGAFLSTDQLKQALDRLQAKKNLILQGPPGVGKTFIARMLAYALIEQQDDDRIEFVQFHQSYSYEDFVRGYRPLPDEGGKFGLQDGVFFEFCERARNDSDRRYVFIIDEINRGNLSQIFGELLMLIESDKRGPAYAVPLVYRKPDEPRFSIPANVHVIGLMNLADRSLALVDYALRRRFAFLSLQSAFGSEVFRHWLQQRNMRPALVDLIVERMSSLNSQIAADTLLGENYQVGHSFFCPKGDDFSSLDRDWYERIVETEIVPLLKEYWFDNSKRVDEVRRELLAP